MSCFSKKEEPSGEPLVDEPVLRIVLLGKARVGKSASGNTILGSNNLFPSKGGPSAVTETCQKETGKVNGQEVLVVDTPGLFRSGSTEQDEVLRELKRSVALAKPGPHVFLIVLTITDRFKETEKKMVELFLDTFGENTLAFTMVLFTRGRALQGTPIEDYIRKSKDLLDLVLRCKWGYHVLENNPKEEDEAEQVPQLMLKINSRVQDMGKTYYTPEMLKAAEIAVIKKQVQNTDEGKQTQRTCFQTLVYSGIGMGCVLGYFAGGGQVTSTIGAALGSLGGGLLGTGLFFLIKFIKERIKCKCPC